MRNFVKWFENQAGRGDRIGDVSRDIVNYAAFKRLNIRSVLRARCGGLTRKALRRDSFMSLALDEFNHRKKEGTLSSFKMGDPEENFETARQLNAIALYHGVIMGKIPTEEEAPVEETSFEYYTLQGVRCYTIVTKSADSDPVLRTWFDIGDFDVKALSTVGDFDLLNHCRAMVEMWFVRGSYFGVLLNEEPFRWIYNVECLKGLQGLFSGYADKFKKPGSEENSPLQLK